MKFWYPINSVMRQCLRKDALTIMILYLLFLIFCNLICYVIAYFVRGDEEKPIPSHWVKCGITTVLEIVLLFILRGIATAFFDADNQPFAVAPLLVTLLLVGLGTAFSRRNTTSNLRNYLRKAAWIAGVVFVLESFVFHYTSFTTHPETTDLVLSQAEINDASAAQIVDDTIQISGNCTLTFSNLEQNPDFRYLILNIDGEDHYYNVSCSIKDDNLSNRFEQAGKSQGTGTYSSIRFSMLPYQTLHTVQLQFTDVNAALVLHNGTFHTAVPYHFSAARFFLIVIIALVLTACKQFRIWNIRYRAHSWKHNLAVLVTLFGCMASVLAFRVPDLEATTLNDPIDINNVYAMTLDAWEKGQTNMDLTPSEELLQSETPYDNSNREGVYYNWDYAFYNGKYYCYFGCAPVALLYVPYYELTGNVLPLNWAYCIMTEAVIVTLFGLILTLVRKFCKRPPLILLLLGLVSAVAGSGVLFGLNYSDRYFNGDVRAVPVALDGLCSDGFQLCRPDNQTAAEIIATACPAGQWRTAGAGRNPDASFSVHRKETGELEAVCPAGSQCNWNGDYRRLPSEYAALCPDFSAGISAPAVPERPQTFRKNHQCRLLSDSGCSRSSSNHVVQQNPV